MKYQRCAICNQIIALSTDNVVRKVTLQGYKGKYKVEYFLDCKECGKRHRIKRKELPFITKLKFFKDYF